MVHKNISKPDTDIKGRYHHSSSRVCLEHSLSSLEGQVFVKCLYKQ